MDGFDKEINVENEEKENIKHKEEDIKEEKGTKNEIRERVGSFLNVLGLKGQNNESRAPNVARYKPAHNDDELRRLQNMAYELINGMFNILRRI